MQFVSKLQYKDCEPGEFFDSAMRTFDDTVSLIKEFPWALQREYTPVQLTCPSVTIKHSNGTYLKLGPFYNGKFTLYLLVRSGKVLHKVFVKLDDCIAVISDYFAGNDISTGFSEMHFISHRKKHFVTEKFEYVVSGKRILQFLFFPEIFLLVYFGLTIITASHGGTHQLEGLLFGLGLMALLVGPNWYLFFNYFNDCKDIYLRMSRGHQKFLFRTKTDMEEFDKADIEKVFIYMNTASRSLIHGYCIYEICFLNGYRIRISCLLMNEYQFRGKLPGKEFELVHKGFLTMKKNW